MNEDTFKIRKDRVKNIAIIFLTVMLVLTFFSNSFLNYSLPEVATQYVQPGTITEKVRGTGIVTADDPYKVIIKESREIESVLVKAGEEVTKDQTLFVLKDKESDELKKAQEELDALVFAYAQKILSGEISASSFTDAQNGKEYTINQYQARIQTVNDKVKTAQNKVDNLTIAANSIQKQIDIAANQVVDTTAEENALADAQAKLRNAQKEKDQRSTEYQWALEKANRYSVSDNNLIEIPPGSTWESELEKAREELIAAEQRLEAAQKEVTNRQYDVDNAQAALDRVKNAASSTVSKAQLTTQLAETNAALNTAKSELEKAREEQTNVVKDVQLELELGNQNSLIAEKQKEIEQLRTDSIGAVIKSPVDGTVMSVSKTAGETTTPEEELASIQVAGKGFSVSFSVTNAQAAKVNVGDVAELQNAWWYADVKATLEKIRPDTEDPGKKKQLIFKVEGSIQSGESLSLSIGQKSADYDSVVPNSAVREDKNGKFILIIEQKSTPFGNRYKARRVDVQVLAGDDTQSAVIGELENYVYVITTSNKPVKAGDQVRLSEN